MSEPKQNIVTVIVNYKSKDLTLKGLESLLNEKAASPHLNITAVVVENASGEYEDILSQVQSAGWDNWVTVIDSDKNGGFGYGNNLGFKYGFEYEPVDFFYLLNPDARCHPNAVSALVEPMNKDSSVAITGSTFFNDDGSLWPIAFRFPSIFSEIERGFRLGFISKLLKNWVVAREMEQVQQPVDWVAGASMMLRASVVKNLKGFDESFFLYYEETDLCMRVKKAGLKTLYVPKSKVLHIAGQSTKVTERNSVRKRVPDYWYQSRSMYFRKNHGFFYAIATDVLAISSHLLGNLRLFLFRKSIGTPYYFVRDTISNSVFNSKVSDNSDFKSMLK